MMEITAHNLMVALGGRTVLHRIGFTAKAGEFICILGPNGAGKSTLLRALAGLSRDKGVVVGGTPIEALSAKMRARMIAWLPQTGQAIWPLSVRSIVALGRMPHGVTLDSLTPQDEDAIAHALNACDLEHLALREVTTLSGGERARALLARALAVDAPIVMADEPVSALDPQHQLSVMEALRAQARQGKIVLSVLHDLSLAARFADRIVLLKDGRIAGDGSPKDVLAADILRTVFGVEIVTWEENGVPLVLPVRVAQR